MKVVSDICYSERSGQLLDIYLPDADVFPVFLYFHGGGLTGGDKTNTKVFLNYLASHGIAAVSANYRLYPNASYPDFLRDAAEAAAWVKRHMGEYGKVTDLYIGGSSAGGYISQMLCFDRKWLGEYGLNPMDFAGFVHDAGQPTCHFNVLKERGLDSRRVIVDEYSPLFYVGADETYPAMLIIVSDNDMENRYEQTLLLNATLKHFGHSDNVQLTVMNGKHCAYIGMVDEDGMSVFGKLIEAFIND